MAKRKSRERSRRPTPDVIPDISHSLKTMKVHYLYDESCCGCGDSFCSDCRDYDEVIACGARITIQNKLKATSRHTAHVDCASCMATERWRSAARVNLIQADTVSSVEDTIAACIQVLWSRSAHCDTQEDLIGWLDSPKGRLAVREALKGK